MQPSDVYDKLRQLIISGAFEMGERLGEDRLASTLGTSRTPVRAALSRLEVEGYLTYSPNRGHRMKVYTREDVREIYACRAILESEAVLTLTEGGPSDALVQSLSSLIEEMEDCVRSGSSPAAVRSRYLPLNHVFHATLHSACPNSRLRELIRQLTDVPLVIRNYFNFSGGEFLESHQEHKRILNAIVNRESRRAAYLMREHIWAARERMLEPRQRSSTASSVAGADASPSRDSAHFMLNAP